MKKALLVAFSLLFCFQIGFAERSGCTPTQEGKAEHDAIAVHTWDALYASFHHYAECDDGAVAEGYDASVARLLLDHWNTLPRLTVLSDKNSRCKPFVLRHVSVTALDTKRLKTLKSNASKHCPVGQTSVCNDLRDRVDALLRDN
jgi:hypothetical protein